MDCLQWWLKNHLSAEDVSSVADVEFTDGVTHYDDHLLSNCPLLMQIRSFAAFSLADIGSNFAFHCPLLRFINLDLLHRLRHRTVLCLGLYFLV